MHTTPAGTITENEAWLIAIADILDATGTILDHLRPDTRDQINRIITRETPGYNDSDDLAHLQKLTRQARDRFREPGRPVAAHDQHVTDRGCLTPSRLQLALPVHR